MTENIIAHVLDPGAVDATVRPQDDFYRHVNGTWLATHTIPADRASDGAFHALRDRSEEWCRDICQDAEAGTIDDPDAERIAILHRQFMDEAAVEAAGATPIAGDLAELAAIDSHDAFAAHTGTLMRRGVGSFFGVWVGTDHADSSRYQVNVSQSGLGLPDESWYREDAHADAREAYVRHVANVLALVTDDTRERCEERARTVMEFETRLASHHWATADLRDPVRATNPTTWAQLIDEAPAFGWRAWAEAVGLDIDAHPDLNVGQPDCLRDSVTEWRATDLDTLKAWATRKLVDSTATLLSSAFVEESFDFHGRTLSGTEELRPRWKRAVSLIEGCLGESLGRIWVARHFPPAHKERMDALVADLLDAYRESITHLEWMGPETREKALAKLDRFLPKIGHPDTWRDHSGLTISAEATLVENVRAVAEFDTDYEWARLDRPVDRTEWFMTPQTVNAYYNPTSNEIAFPAAILQPPFFDPEADDAVNFGAIGAVIGHEIGHGFDDQGSRFDGDGNLVNWWDDADRERFDARAQALIAQFDGLVPADLAGTVPEGTGVNGALTVGENIGDLGGLTIAWKAWERALARDGVDDPFEAPVIDGLTGPQRFFLSWARIWRTLTRREFAVQLLSIDPHSPAEFRCNVIASNLPQFHRTWDVHEGDGMWRPESERVSIW